MAMQDYKIREPEIMEVIILNFMWALIYIRNMLLINLKLRL